jgi:hypothetical protein
MAFKYLRDPLFLFCVGLYFLNRFVLKPYVPLSFFRNHLNDVICIPFWVPIMLYMMRKCRLRGDDDPPRSYEILVPLILWSFVFEVWLPTTSLFHGLAFADPMDVLSYVVGALLAAILWKWSYRRRAAKAA